MKVLNFKEVSGGADDANVQYFVPADEILALETTDGAVLSVFLKAVAGTSNDEVGDKFTITCAAGTAVTVGNAIAELMYGNMSSGAVPVIGADFEGSVITTLTLTAV
jgi:hypothetical protein